ncbi:MAG: hypothetical protein K6F05_07355 [Succinivibrio sp.]|nr:hypothetical protein [Succinivibrio sp.]
MNLFGKLQNEKIVFGLLLLIFMLIVIIGAVSSSVPDSYVKAPAPNHNISVKCLQYVTLDGKTPLENTIAELAQKCRDSYASQGIKLSNYYDTEIYKHEPDAKQGLRIMLSFKPEK